MAATTRPSSAPLFLSGSEEYGLEPASNQFLGHQANHHDGQSTLAPGGNKVQRGQIPRTSGPVVGTPSAINPLGAGDSLTG